MKNVVIALFNSVSCFFLIHYRWGILFISAIRKIDRNKQKTETSGDKNKQLKFLKRNLSWQT